MYRLEIPETVMFALLSIGPFPLYLPKKVPVMRPCVEMLLANVLMLPWIPCCVRTEPLVIILFEPASTSPIKFFAITEPDEKMSIPVVATGPTKLPETRVTVTVFVNVFIDPAVMFEEVTMVAGMMFLLLVGCLVIAAAIAAITDLIVKSCNSY